MFYKAVSALVWHSLDDNPPVNGVGSARRMTTTRQSPPMAELNSIILRAVTKKREREQFFFHQEG